MTAAEQVAEALTPGTVLHDVAARLYREHVRIDNGCWSWAGSSLPRGYGRVRFGPRDGQVDVYAHRLSYAIHHGPIPEGLHVLHSCDNPICTNPLHLRLGTDADNSGDAMARGQLTKKVPPKRIDELAGRVARGEMTGVEAAAEVGVLKGTVYAWVKRRRARGLLADANSRGS